MTAILYIFFTVLIGIYANRLNRNVVGWVICSLVISPLLTGLLLLVLGPSKEEK